ncbi:MAG TPA: MFS transporter [Nocardioidaceae bacterium]|nr:MFS transporter [Nocardioidaceae bacterium]
MSETPTGIADLSALERINEHKAWYWYDWANSGYVTTVATVLFAPYLISVAEKSVGCATGEDAPDCTRNLDVLGVAVSPGSLPFYVVTAATILSALVLPIVGAAADRSSRKPTLMARYAWVGSLAAASMFFVAGENWQLGALLMFVTNISLGSSLVVYDAILCEISTPDERDRVSSRGWAYGYLGGGVLLVANLALVTLHDTFGLDQETAVRISLLSAGIWWAAFTFIPYRRIKNRPAVNVVPEHGGLVKESFGQLFATLRDLRNYPVTLTFLVAYLFYNDGIQTVIATASTYGEKELGFETEVLIATILLVQFLAFGGALLFGKLAQTHGARKVVLAGLGLWMVIVTVAYFIPEDNIALFLALAAGIGLVLGGTQALSRSFFSQLIPRGREAEYFSLYQACERGTSWLGTLIFGLMHQWTDSYRPAVFALIVFFVIGGALLWKVDPRRGIADAGNQAPSVV